MSTQQTAEPALGFAELFDRIAGNVAQVIQGKDDVIELVAAVPRRRGPPPARGRARRRQDQPGQGAGRAPSTARSAACSSPPTCCRPTSSASASATARPTAFEFRPGPVFANIVLADEINRASPKTQSALLECHGRAPGHRRRPRPTPWPRPSWSSPPRTRSSTRAPTPCPRASSTGSSCGSRWATRAARPSSRSSTAHADARRARRPPAGGHRRRGPRHGRRGAGVHVAPALPEYLVDLAEATRRHPASPSACRPGPPSASSGSPGPGPPPPGAATSRPTTSRRWPCRCSPTASSSPPRPSCRASRAADALDDVLRTVPIPDGSP